MCVCFSKDVSLRETLIKSEEYIKELAKVKELVIEESGERPKDAVSALAAGDGERMGAEVFVPLAGLIDFEVETKRLQKELDKLLGEYSGIQKKLANEDFLGKAPKEVVEKERQRLTALLEKKIKLEAGVERIRSLRG